MAETLTETAYQAEAIMTPRQQLNNYMKDVAHGVSPLTAEFSDEVSAMASKLGISEDAVAKYVLASQIIALKLSLSDPSTKPMDVAEAIFGAVGTRLQALGRNTEYMTGRLETYAQGLTLKQNEMTSQEAKSAITEEGEESLAFKMSATKVIPGTEKVVGLAIRALKDFTAEGKIQTGKIVNAFVNMPKGAQEQIFRALLWVGEFDAVRKLFATIPEEDQSQFKGIALRYGVKLAEAASNHTYDQALLAA